MNKQLVRISLLMAVLVILFSGCATNNNDQPDASPMVGGSMSAGAARPF
jgi:predicted component of type VI protein secretion system